MVGKLGPGCCCAGTPACSGGYDTEIDYDFSTDPLTGIWTLFNPNFITTEVSGGVYHNAFSPTVSIKFPYQVTRNRPWTDQPPGIWDSSEVSFTLPNLEQWGAALPTPPYAYHVNTEASVYFLVQFGRLSVWYYFETVLSGSDWYHTWRYGAAALTSINPTIPGGGLCQYEESTGLSTATSNPLVSAGDVIKGKAIRVDGTTGTVELYKNGSLIGSHTNSYTWPGYPYPAAPWNEVQCQKTTTLSLRGVIPRFSGLTFDVDDLLMQTNTV